MVEASLMQERLNIYSQGYAAFQFLTAGLELGVFDLLAKSPGLTAFQIGQGLKLEAQPLRVLLSGLLALKLIYNDGDGYHNDPIVEERLISGSPRSMTSLLRWIKYGINKGLTEMTELIRQNRNVGVERFQGVGNTIYQRLESDPELSRIFQECLKMFAYQAPVALSKVEAFSKLNHILDVGGGDGTHAMTLARAFPHLRITIFDSEPVCATAEKHVAKAGLSDRIDTCVGDMFTDPFPKGPDGVFMSQITPIWSPERNKSLFGKAHEILPEGGALVILAVMIDDFRNWTLGSSAFLALFPDSRQR